MIGVRWGQLTLLYDVQRDMYILDSCSHIGLDQELLKLRADPQKSMDLMTYFYLGGGVL